MKRISKMLTVLSVFLSCFLLLTACMPTSDTSWSQLTDGKVVEKKIEHGFKTTSYKVLIEKEGQKANFRINQNVYKMIEVGTVISGKYNGSGYLTNVKLSAFQ